MLFPFVSLSLDLPILFSSAKYAIASGESAGAISSQPKQTFIDLFFVPAQDTKNLIQDPCKLHEYTSSLCRQVPTLDPVFFPL